MVCAVGGNAEGKRAAAEPSATAAFAACGVSAPAAPATATPVRNLRRSTFGPESFVPGILACHDALPRNEILGGDSRLAASMEARLYCRPICRTRGRRDENGGAAWASPARNFSGPEASLVGAAKHLIGNRFPLRKRGVSVRAITLLPGVPRSAQLEDIPEPPESHGSLLVRTLALGVCGTDREIVAGAYGEAPPGHRAAGARP